MTIAKYRVIGAGILTAGTLLPSDRRGGIGSLDSGCGEPGRL